MQTGEEEQEDGIISTAGQQLEKWQTPKYPALGNVSMQHSHVLMHPSLPSMINFSIRQVDHNPNK